MDYNTRQDGTGGSRIFFNLYTNQICYSRLSPFQTFWLKWEDHSLIME